ncbi:cation diffusion facilitator family protein [Thecamonas trahens ATCC 50062]|uniref:Cation diffusion facilitator family protein n=1 Tax=Thecamonas trahens ATCC 50062 TaxID=461836 RepID=A0A0L0D650_THETB|nr:cation diffusion facilitator family protein [Thecamonas trahens ATCC 50062]KNC47829.1 cation diffusion facilitator family protein [Thecamonas trahens ATCC 50062]|eukprot:XP_013759307.1 cation diffusion facilitator family protein [Thecamonas trahens ATCC 50062]
MSSGTGGYGFTTDDDEHVALLGGDHESESDMDWSMTGEPLTAAILNPEAAAALKAERRAELEALRMDDEAVRAMPSRVSTFYRQQNAYIDSLHELDEVTLGRGEGSPSGRAGAGVGGGMGGRLGDGDGSDSASAVDVIRPRNAVMTTSPPATPSAVQLVVRLSLAVNVVLFVAKVFAAVASGSLAVFASAVDSALDLVSGLIMFVTERAISRRDPYKYPVGRRRLEPLGIIVFASVMGTAALQLILTGALRLLDGGADISLSASTITVLGFTIVAKLGLLRSPSLCSKATTRTWSRRWLPTTSPTSSPTPLALSPPSFRP